MKPEAYEELQRFEVTHGWYVGMRQITASILDGMVDTHSQMLILDAGCGTGGNLGFLSKYGRVMGFDLSAQALQYAKKLHADQLARANIGALPYADNTFDMVASFDVLYHRAVTDDTLAFRELGRVVKPGAHVLIRVPAMPTLRGAHDDAVHGARRYTGEIVLEKLEQAGLKIKRMTRANSLLMPAVYVWRKLSQTNPDSDMSGTDVAKSNGLVGELLKFSLGIEAGWIARGHNFALGVSLFAVAQKPA